MAKLDEKNYPGIWEWDQKEPFETYVKRMDEQFKNIPKDKVIYFQIADGYAYYFIKSLKPLVLQHIPYGDGYMVLYPTIRGLRACDLNLYRDNFLVNQD